MCAGRDIETSIGEGDTTRFVGVTERSRNPPAHAYGIEQSVIDGNTTYLAGRTVQQSSVFGADDMEISQATTIKSAAAEGW
jgi:hypothetical protein